jgi:hypothetical protein
MAGPDALERIMLRAGRPRVELRLARLNLYTSRHNLWCSAGMRLRAQLAPATARFRWPTATMAVGLQLSGDDGARGYEPED